jgi:hypothetical protein
MKRGAGASIFGYFWGDAKSDWPRAAMERAGGKRYSSFRQTLRQAQGERLICASRGLPLSIVTAGQAPRAWQAASSHTGCRRSPRREG